MRLGRPPGPRVDGQLVDAGRDRHAGLMLIGQPDTGLLVHHCFEI
jgi:hypothetical protein